MTFGKQSGLPAPAKQVEELLALLHEAGHADFRDARGPMGFTQRQAGGKFTRDEAAAFIEQLQPAELDGGVGVGGVGGVGGTGPADGRGAALGAHPAVRPSAAQRALRAVPATQLAAELQRRGWVVMEP